MLSRGEKSLPSIAGWASIPTAWEAAGHLCCQGAGLACALLAICQDPRASSVSGSPSQQTPASVRNLGCCYKDLTHKHSIVPGLAHVTHVQKMTLPSGTLMQKINFCEHLATCCCLKHKHGLIRNKRPHLTALSEVLHAQSQFQSRELFLFTPFLLLNRMSSRTNLIIQEISSSLKQQLLDVIVYFLQHNKKFSFASTC